MYFVLKKSESVDHLQILYVPKLIRIFFPCETTAMFKLHNFKNTNLVQLQDLMDTVAKKIITLKRKFRSEVRKEC